MRLNWATISLAISLASALPSDYVFLHRDTSISRGDNRVFTKLHDDTQRGIHAFVLFNAVTPDLQCQICAPVQAAFEAIARAIPVADKTKNRIVIMHMDLKKTRDSFLKVPAIS